MSHQRRLRFKTLLMVLLMVLCANVGETLLKIGMTRIGAVQLTFPGIQHALLATLFNGVIWLGILCLIGFTVCYMTAVSWADYSYVMPAGAFGYATQTLLAVAVLHESVSSMRWFGVSLICVGVMLVGQTNPNTTKSSSSSAAEPVSNPLVGPLAP